MSARRELVRLALQPEANIRELSRRLGISRTTAYYWIRRYEAEGEKGLDDRSRRPKTSPNRSSDWIEARVLAIRDEEPAWGAPMIAAILEREYGVHRATSTIHAILRRHGRIDRAASERAAAWKRFEKKAPNDLWQMDFKGHFATAEGRCYPLTVLDDHSRYSIVLSACRNERMTTVQPLLIAAFRRYGMPLAILTDNGNPWGNASAAHPYTALTVWMMRLGITPPHSRPLHPQTMGKDERFHRTLKTELVGTRTFAGYAEVQAAFGPWRERYNHYRPHSALGRAVPASRYTMSPRSYPESLPSLEYNSTDIVRTVSSGGSIRFRGHSVFFCEAFSGEQIALRQTSHPDFYDIFYAHRCVGFYDGRLHTAMPRPSQRHDPNEPDQKTSQG